MELRKMKEDYYKYFTEKDSMEAVKQDGDALRYVNESCLPTERTIQLDGKEIIISEESYQAFKEQFNQ